MERIGGNFFVAHLFPGSGNRIFQSRKHPKSYSESQIIILSKNFPTYPWKIPQTQNQQFMKEFFSYGGCGKAWGMLQGYVGVLLDITNIKTMHCV